MLIPFVFAFLLSAVVLALSPGLGLKGEDWGRMGALTGVFALYLTVFAGFGLWASALTHRRMTAFLGLLGLWTLWVFVIPNLAVDLAQRLVPAQSVYDLERSYISLRQENRKGKEAERDAYWEQHPIEDWSALPEEQKEEHRKAMQKINASWEEQFYARLSDRWMGWHNQMRKQRDWAMVLSTISPLSPVSLASMDLARTGLVQQERLENDLNVYIIYMAQYIQEKDWDEDLTDFSLFTYRENEALEACLARNAFHILNLALLAILGFAGAYVAILRYDVR